MIMCALDFCRALNERGWIARLLFRFAVGKYAFREYELLVINLELRGGYDTKFDYGLEDCKYHKKTIRQIRNEWSKVDYEKHS